MTPWSSAILLSMSRKHAPPPDTDPLTISKAIARRLHEIRDSGGTPAIIVVGTGHRAHLSRRGHRRVGARAAGSV